MWRRSRRWVLIAAAGLLGLVVAAVVAIVVFVNSTNPPDPNEFYAAPSPLPSGPPGTVIRTQEVEQPPERSRGWKILYLSRSYTGEPRAVSGLLFVPTTPAAGRDIVASTHGTVGVAPGCAVSIGNWFFPPHRWAAGVHSGRQRGRRARLPGTRHRWPASLPGRRLRGNSDARRRSCGASLRAGRGGDQVRRLGRLPGWPRFSLHRTGGSVVLARAEAPRCAGAAPATDLKTLFEVNRNTTFGRILSAFALATWSKVYPQLRLEQVVTAAAQPVVRQFSRICVRGDTSELIAHQVVTSVLRLSYLSKMPWETEPWKGLLAESTPRASRFPHRSSSPRATPTTCPTDRDRGVREAVDDGVSLIAEAAPTRESATSPRGRRRRQTSSNGSRIASRANPRPILADRRAKRHVQGLPLDGL
jgi:hypothetical protein